jgi:FHS family L-fucose permease-like MFS transporter
MTADPAESGRRTLLGAVYFTYFFCGLTLCFDNLFNPDFRILFGLSYRELMYTKPAFALTGLVFPLVAGSLAARFGYKKCLTLALLLFGAANLLVVPALHGRSYALLLGALFVMGLGFNLELVAGNPLMAALGRPETASSRVNLGNALGAVAQIIPPLLLAFVIFPSDALTTVEKVPVIQRLFLAFAAVLFVVAVVLSAVRDPLASGSASPAPGSAAAPAPRGGLRALFSRPRLTLGFAAIFLAIGVEAGFQGLYLNFLQDAARIPATKSLLWQTVNLTVFALGRLFGSFLQKRKDPARVLAAYAAASMVLLVPVVFARGAAAVAALTLSGFFYCVFFPTIYTLAIEGLGDLTPRASGFLVMGLSGISVIPVLQGAVADRAGLQGSYALGFLPWAFVLWYALRLRRGPAPAASGGDAA